MFLNKMRGLLQKARAIKRNLKPQLTRQEKTVDADAAVSFDEQAEILADINESIAASQSKIEPETLSYTAKKNGAFVPLIVNASALLVAVVTVLVLFFYFNFKERSLVSDTRDILTAEGKLVAALKKDAENRIAEKDLQIVDIQSKLEKLRQEKDQLNLEVEARVQAREDELRELLTEQLAAEKVKLKQAGLTDDDVAQRLQTVEQELLHQNREQMDSFRQSAEAQLAEKEAAINSLIQEYNQQLSRFKEEKAQFQETLRQREIELQARFEDETNRLESEMAQALEQLSNLQDKKVKEQQAFDQILILYDGIKAGIRERRFSDAQVLMDNLEDFLSRDSILALPAIQRRAPVELFILNSLRESIQNEQAAVDVASLVASADLLTSISNYAEQADALYQVGDTESAQKLYLSAIENIPDIKKSYETLKAIEKQSVAEEKRQLNSLIGVLQAQLSTTEEVLESESSRWKAKEQERAVIADQLETIKDQYLSTSSNSSTRPSNPQETIESLLEAKLLVRQVVASDSIRSQYPDLYEKMELYFDAFGTEQLKTGQTLALRDVIQVLSAVVSEDGKTDLQNVLDRYDEAEQQELFLRFFDSLHILLENESGDESVKTSR